jgi:hypothetical protein
MRLRQEQLARIEKDSEARFQGEVAAFLRRELPEEVEGLSRQQLDDLIAQAESRAAVYGIDEPVPLVQFICLSLAAGEAFDSDPDISAYLAQPEVDQTTKMQALVDEFERLSEQPD